VREPHPSLSRAALNRAFVRGFREDADEGSQKKDAAIPSALVFSIKAHNE
jgi:hypothetical protein